MRAAIILAAVLCAASSLAQAQTQDWRPAARQCGEQYAQWFRDTYGHPCASCSAGWPDIARCTVKTVEPQISHDALEACIRRTNDKDWDLPMAHDRIGDVLQCLREQADR
jgi:hypothetical protein